MQSTIKSKLSLLISSARPRELAGGVRGQAGRSSTLDPLTNICSRTRLSLWFPDAGRWTNRRVTLGSAEASGSALLNQWSNFTALSVKLK